MLAEYSKVLEILERCTSEQVSQAEAELKELAIKDLQILACLQQVLRDSALEKKIHTIATSHINSIFSSNTTEYTQEFSLQFFTLLLKDNNISMDNKKEVSRSLMYCIEQCDNEYLAKWKELTLSCVMNENFYEIGLILLTAFSCSQIRQNLVEEIDEKPFYFTMEMLCKNFKDFEHYKKMGFVFGSWKITIEYLMHFSPLLAASLLIRMANSEYLTKALTIAYSDYSSSKDSHYLYINDQDYELTEKINEMKKEALEVHQLLISESIKHTKNTTLYVYTGQQIETFVNSLCFASMQQGFLEEYHLEDVIIEMLKIVRIVSVDSPSILRKSWRQLLHYILFPFMHVSGQELEDFEADTNSFVEVSEDCCEKQRMGILKTEGALFLEKLSDMSEEIIQYSSEGIEEERNGKVNKFQPLITKYVIRFAIASIKDQLQMQFINKDDFLIEQEMPESAPVLPLETSFLILSIFSFCIEDFPKEIEDIKVILCSEQIKGLPPLERARIYTFLAYNYEEIFSNSENYNIRHWVDFAFMEESHPTVAYCALDFITNSLQKVYDERSINAIIRRIATNTSANFWGLLKKMTTLFLFKFSEETLIALIQQIYGRISFEILKFSQQHLKMTFVINYLLQIIRIICEKGEFIQSRPIVRQLLWSTSEIYTVSVQNYFEDDVVKIINCFLFFATQEEIEHPQIHNFLNLFAKDFEKNLYEHTHYYISFNCMLMKGSLENTVLPIYYLLKKSLSYNLKEKEKKEAGRKKLPIAHTLLLLQNIVAIHGSSIPIEEIKFMSSILETLYPKSVERISNGSTKSKLVIYDRVLLARGLNLQFLCNMYSPNPSLLLHLRKYHDLRIFYGYDVSVILECLKHLILKEENMLNISEILRILIKIIDSYIDMDTELKIHNINQKERKIMSANSLQEEGPARIEEEHESKEEKRRSELVVRIKKATDYEVILAFISTPFLKEERKVIGYNKGIKEVEDISKEFTKLLNGLRTLNPALIESILSGYSESVIQKLNIITDKSSTNDEPLAWRQSQSTKNWRMEESKRQEVGRKVYRILKSKIGVVEDDVVEESGVREFICGEESLRDEEGEDFKNNVARSKKTDKSKNFE